MQCSGIIRSWKTGIHPQGSISRNINSYGDVAYTVRYARLLDGTICRRIRLRTIHNYETWSDQQTHEAITLAQKFGHQLLARTNSPDQDLLRFVDLLPLLSSSTERRKK